MRILIVDDADLIRNLIRNLLTSLPFPTCMVEAADVPQALSILRRWQPDVVTLDLQLPGGSGLRVLRAIEQAGLHSRVIVVTSVADSRIWKACFEAGAAYVLDKSFDLEQLPNILKAVADLTQDS